MTFNALELLAALAGLILAVVVAVVPRFGPASWTLSVFLVPGALASASLGLISLVPAWTFRSATTFALSALVVCAAGACLAGFTINRDDYAGHLRKRRWSAGALAAAVPVILLLTHAFPASPAGHYSALYMILASVIALATLEQTLRSAEEHVRWEIKFLLLGIASSVGAILYSASTILLYPARYAAFSVESLWIFPLIFLFSCAMIFQSWRRSTGRSRVVVSQGVIYSTITLLSVGAYLIVAGLAARRVGAWSTDVPAEALFFIVSVLVLLTAVTGTAFRHRMNRWIRRHVFSGRYDYRSLWIDASERVRTLDSTAVPVEGLADLIHGTVGSLEISIWGRDGDSDSMYLLAVRGSIGGRLPDEIPDAVRGLQGITTPVSVEEVGAGTELPAILRQAEASLVVPLVSARRLVGFITVGADRSGKPFDWETREFLRVLAVHSASEFHKAELLAALVESREAEAIQTVSTFLLHDLKNFASTLSLIAKNAGRHRANPAFQLDAFQSIVDISEKMKRLCSSLRTFSGTLAANKEACDLNGILEMVSGAFETTSGRTVRRELSSLPPVLADREEIGRLIQNLLMNAHEASPDGAAVALRSAAENGRIAVTVTDRGKGIPAGFLEKGMFQPFHTTKPEGLGIGLFHSKKIVEAHAGSIEVISREGYGTTIRILLPAIDTFVLEAARR